MARDGATARAGIRARKHTATAGDATHPRRRCWMAVASPSGGGMWIHRLASAITATGGVFESTLSQQDQERRESEPRTGPPRDETTGAHAHHRTVRGCAPQREGGAWGGGVRVHVCVAMWTQRCVHVCAHAWGPGGWMGGFVCKPNGEKPPLWWCGCVCGGHPPKSCRQATGGGSGV
eukprot:2917444-Prymnesium_polylepis.1